MAKSKLVRLLFEAWKDLDRAIDGLSHEDAVEKHFGGSSIAWTYAHATNQVDNWVNKRFAEKELHPLIDQGRFRFGGTGEAEDWEAVRKGSRTSGRP